MFKGRHFERQMRADLSHYLGQLWRFGIVLSRETQSPKASSNRHAIGVGADLASGSPMGKVVDGEITGVTDAGGAVVDFQVQRIFATSELETLGIARQIARFADSAVRFSGR